MNKVIKYLLSVAVGLVTLTACETYGDPKYEASSIGPVMSGYWLGEKLEDITDPMNVKVLVNAEDFYWLYDAEEMSYYGATARIATYSDANASTDHMWIWYNNGPLGLRGKVGIDLSKYEILPANGTSTMTIEKITYIHDFSVLSGTVKANGYNTRSGGKSDLLTVIYTLQSPAAQGKTLRLTAWKDTLWPKDYPPKPTTPPAI